MRVNNIRKKIIYGLTDIACYILIPIIVFCIIIQDKFIDKLIKKKDVKEKE